MGTAVRMGPGFFPTLLGGLLALLGLMVAAKDLWVNGEPVRGWAFRPLVLVFGAVLAFAFLVQSLGLVLATLALVVIRSLGGWEFRLREVAVLCLLSAALAVGVFAYGLGLPFKVWPG